VPGPTPAWLTSTINAVGDYVAPSARLVAALAFVALCLTGRWAWRDPELPAVRPEWPRAVS
jgi:hypothetical protein